MYLNARIISGILINPNLGHSALIHLANKMHEFSRHYYIITLKNEAKLFEIM